MRRYVEPLVGISGPSTVDLNPNSDRIARVDSDIGLLQAAFQDMQGTLDHDWGALADVVENIDGLNGQ